MNSSLHPTALNVRYWVIMSRGNSHRRWVAEILHRLSRQWLLLVTTFPKRGKPASRARQNDSHGAGITIAVSYSSHCPIISMVDRPAVSATWQYGLSE